MCAAGQLDTLLKWHRDLIRRKWTFQRSNLGGRPRIDVELESLIVRLARENPRLSFNKIQGKLLKLGYEVDRSTVRNVMRRHHPPPAFAGGVVTSRYNCSPTIGVTGYTRGLPSGRRVAR